MSDTGIGVGAAQREQIFELFSQADSTISRRYGGTGLGLTISLRMIRLMGSDIQLQSEPGEGSTFAFSLKLPWLERAPANDPAPDYPERTEHPLRVLVADDNDVNRMVAEAMLQSLGHECTAVSGGVEAIQELALGQYDVLLLDLEMPVQDGLQTATLLRQDARAALAQLPIVALTAHAAADQEARCRAAGMNAYLAKPFEAAALERALLAAMRGSEPVSDAAADPQLARG